MADLQTLRIEVTDGVGHVILDRPDKLNAINRAMVDELGEVPSLVGEHDLAAVVFSGLGKCFSAGADLTELAAYETADAPLDHIEAIQRAYGAIAELPIPTIAAIHGFAFGGGLELALCCDLRVIAHDARLGVPEILVGLLPGAGGTQRLSAMLPPAIARRMILLGQPIDAATALTHGLVNETCPAGDVLESAIALAAACRGLPPLAVRVGKLLIRQATEGGLQTGIEAERQGMAFLFATEDRREGTRAFVDKRAPSFSGR